MLAKYQYLLKFDEATKCKEPIDLRWKPLRVPPHSIFLPCSFVDPIKLFMTYYHYYIACFSVVNSCQLKWLLYSEVLKNFQVFEIFIFIYHMAKRLKTLKTGTPSFWVWLFVCSRQLKTLDAGNLIKVELMAYVILYRGTIEVENGILVYPIYNNIQQKPPV